MKCLTKVIRPMCNSASSGCCWKGGMSCSHRRHQNGFL